jgi:hypothetical protein
MKTKQINMPPTTHSNQLPEAKENVAPTICRYSTPLIVVMYFKGVT